MKKFLLLALLFPAMLYAHYVPVSNATIEDEVFIWKVVSVDFRDECTIVHKEVTPKVVGTTIFSTKDEYIEDSSTNEHFYISYSTLGFDPVEVYHTNTISFTEIYPPVRHLEKINIYSGSIYYKVGLEVWPMYTAYPYVSRSSDGQYSQSEIKSISMSDAYTLVTLNYTSYYEDGWVSFNSDFYLTDGKTFKVNIMDALICDEAGQIVGNLNLDEKYSVYKGKQYTVMLIFPRVTPGIYEIDIIEPEGFYWRGVRINNVQ